MGCASCCVSIFTIFKCRDCIVRRVAFCPPRPSSYDIIHDMLYITTAKGYVRPFSLPWLQFQTVILKTYKNNTIPALYFTHSDSDFTIIYSHGNSTDIGKLYNYMLELATQLKVSILVYEYSGYGTSTGLSSEIAIKHDIIAAYEYLLQYIPWKNIILFGNSLGSYPACILSSSYPVAGVILQSPIASGLSLFYNSVRADFKRDIFNNLALASKIKCPVLVIHGKEDDIIPISHAENIVSLLQISYTPLWISHGGHNDIELDHRNEFLSHLREFLLDLISLQKNPLNLEKFDMQYKSNSSTAPLIESSSKNTTNNVLDHTILNEIKYKAKKNKRNV